MTDFKPGDRVRVVIEDTVERVDYFDGTVYLANAHDLENESWFREDEPTVVSVEKVEPPVEVFGRGDIVRSKKSGHTYLITDQGYVEMNEDIRGYANLPATFTSRGYEKINLVEAPF